MRYVLPCRVFDDFENRGTAAAPPRLGVLVLSAELSSHERKADIVLHRVGKLHEVSLADCAAGRMRFCSLVDPCPFWA